MEIEPTGQPQNRPAPQRNQEYTTSFEASKEKCPTALWASAVDASRRAKHSNQKRELYRQKAKYLSILWRVGGLDVCGAEITASRDLLLFVRYGIGGLHVPFDFLDKDFRRAIWPTVVKLVMGEDIDALISRLEAA